MKFSFSKVFKSIPESQRNDFLDLLIKAVGHKYIKRTGGPGNYRYWYKDEKTGKITEGKKPEDEKEQKISEIKKPWEMTKKEWDESEYLGKDYLKMFDELIVSKTGTKDINKIVDFYKKKYDLKVPIEISILEKNKATRRGSVKVLVNKETGKLSRFVIELNSGAHALSTLRHEIEHIIDREKFGFVPNSAAVSQFQYKKEGESVSDTMRREEKGHHKFYDSFGIDYPHRAFVKQALSEGKGVPPEVLADYPELKNKKKDFDNRVDKMTKELLNNLNRNVKKEIEEEVNSKKNKNGKK